MRVKSKMLICAVVTGSPNPELLDGLQSSSATPPSTPAALASYVAYVPVIVERTVRARTYSSKTTGTYALLHTHTRCASQGLLSAMVGAVRLRERETTTRARPERSICAYAEENIWRVWKSAGPCETRRRRRRRRRRAERRQREREKESKRREGERERNGLAWGEGVEERGWERCWRRAAWHSGVPRQNRNACVRQLFFARSVCAWFGRATPSQADSRAYIISMDEGAVPEAIALRSLIIWG